MPEIATPEAREEVAAMVEAPQEVAAMTEVLTKMVAAPKAIERPSPLLLFGLCAF